MICNKILYIKRKMNYDIDTGLMKENSLTAKIYFLLLKKPLCQSDISHILYNGKIQLDNIKPAIQKLLKAKYIQKLNMTPEEKEKQGIDKRAILFKANYKPLYEYIEKIIEERNDSSKEKDRAGFTKEDKQVLDLILNSKWFQKFYNEDFLSTQETKEIKIKKEIQYSSSCPIRYFAFFLEDLFDTGFELSVKYKNHITNKDILLVGDFDTFLANNENRLNDKQKQEIQKKVKEMVKSLGSYKNTQIVYDYYFKDFGILFFPPKLSYKLSCIGRIPLTTATHWRYILSN